MVARVTTYHADEPHDRLLEAFQDTIGPLQQVDGFSHAYFLVDSDTGKAISMTVWESDDAMSASEAGGEQRRRERTEASGAAVESVDHYEEIGRASCRERCRSRWGPEQSKKERGRCTR